MTAGIRKTATCAPDESAISVASLISAAFGDDDGAAVLRCVPDDRDDHGSDEEIAEVGLLGEGLDRVDEDLGDDGGGGGRDAEHEERPAETPAPTFGSGGVQGPKTLQLHALDDHVDQKQDDRDRDRQHLERVAGRVTAPPRDRDHEKEQHGGGDQAE